MGECHIANEPAVQERIETNTLSFVSLVEGGPLGLGLDR